MGECVHYIEVHWLDFIELHISTMFECVSEDAGLTFCVKFMDKV